MPKNKVSEWSSTAASNTDIAGIDISENCAPSGINNAIREIMAQVKDMQSGTDADNFAVGGTLSVTGTSAFTGAITASGGVTGNVTGNLTGNVTGNASTATSATSATTATKATNIAGGGAGQVPYNSGADTTAFLAAGTSGQFLKSNGTSAPSWGDVRALTSDTAKTSTSGSSVEFTSIPSWVKRITVMFDGVSLNGTDRFLIQLGDSGGYETTGYVSTSGNNTSTSGFLAGQNNASDLQYMLMTIANMSGNSWVSSSDTTNGVGTLTGAGFKTLSDVLDRIRVVPTGSNAFDAGSINIMYE